MRRRKVHGNKFWSQYVTTVVGIVARDARFGNVMLHEEFVSERVIWWVKLHVQKEAMRVSFRIPIQLLMRTDSNLELSTWVVRAPFDQLGLWSDSEADHLTLSR